MIFGKEIEMFRNVRKSIPSMIRDIVEKFDFVILDYNRNKQMNQRGEKSDGEQIGEYSLGYARIRISKGLQTNHVDLNFTGRFQASLIVRTSEDYFQIDHRVDYADDIIKKYGNKVLGLQQKYLEDFVSNYLLPQLKIRINDELSRSKR